MNPVFTAHLSETAQSACFRVTSRAPGVPAQGRPPRKQPVFVTGLFLLVRVSLVVGFRAPHSMCTVLPEAPFIFGSRLLEHPRALEVGRHRGGRWPCPQGRRVHGNAPSSSRRGRGRA